MPTNPDWIEHTEKAAWDTVEALREQVQRERERSERLVRLEPSLPQLAQLLDDIRTELGLGVAPPVKLVGRLRDRLHEVTQQRDELQTQLSEQQRKAVPSAASVPSSPISQATSTSSAPPALRWFVRQLRKRYEERQLDADLEPSDDSLAAVATAMDERLSRLAPLPYAPAALLEVALDLGLAAMDLARAARRAQRK